LLWSGRLRSAPFLWEKTDINAKPPLYTHREFA
jgi:hypothetical protein